MQVNLYQNKYMEKIKKQIKKDLSVAERHSGVILENIDSKLDLVVGEWK